MQPEPAELFADGGLCGALGPGFRSSLALKVPAIGV